MDQILIHLWTEVLKLSGTQWIVLLALNLATGVAVFRVFKWIYGVRAENQDHVIALKTTLLEQYKDAASLHTSVRGLSSIIPENWNPYLDQPYRQLQEVLEETTQQQPMNYTAANLGFIADAKLYLVYIRLYHSLTPEQAEALRVDQIAWLKARRAIAEKCVESHAGTLASFEYSAAFIKETEARVTELESRL